MNDSLWHLNLVEQPSEDGIYNVRLRKKDELLSNIIETIMEYENGEWIFTIPSFKHDYIVYAWSYT